MLCIQLVEARLEDLIKMGHSRIDYAGDIGHPTVSKEPEREQNKENNT